MTVTAVFKGENGSLGYLTGKPYTLWAMAGEDRFIIHRKYASVEDSICEYPSLKTFLDNWEVIR